MNVLQKQHKYIETGHLIHFATPILHPPVDLGSKQLHQVSSDSMK